MQKTKAYLVKICIISVLTAAGFVLDRFLSINTPAIKINLAFIPAAFGAMLLGPLAGALIWGLSDLVGAILLPFGPYHPGFTVCAAIGGAMYGLFLYNKNKIRFFPNIVLPVLINCLIIGLLINTFWVSMLYGSKTYSGWLLYRLVEYAVLVPVQLVTLPVLKALSDRVKRIII